MKNFSRKCPAIIESNCTKVFAIQIIIQLIFFLSYCLYLGIYFSEYIKQNDQNRNAQIIPAATNSLIFILSQTLYAYYTVKHNSRIALQAYIFIAVWAFFVNALRCQQVFMIVIEKMHYHQILIGFLSYLYIIYSSTVVLFSFYYYRKQAPEQLLEDKRCWGQLQQSQLIYDQLCFQYFLNIVILSYRIQQEILNFGIIIAICINFCFGFFGIRKQNVLFIFVYLILAMIIQVFASYFWVKFFTNENQSYIIDDWVQAIIVEMLFLTLNITMGFKIKCILKLKLFNEHRKNLTQWICNIEQIKQIKIYFKDYGTSHFRILIIFQIFFFLTCSLLTSIKICSLLGQPSFIIVYFKNWFNSLLLILSSSYYAIHSIWKHNKLELLVSQIIFTCTAFLTLRVYSENTFLIKNAVVSGICYTYVFYSFLVIFYGFSSFPFIQEKINEQLLEKTIRNKEQSKHDYLSYFYFSNLLFTQLSFQFFLYCICVQQYDNTRDFVINIVLIVAIIMDFVASQFAINRKNRRLVQICLGLQIFIFIAAQVWIIFHITLIFNNKQWEELPLAVICCLSLNASFLFTQYKGYQCFQKNIFRQD